VQQQSAPSVLMVVSSCFIFFAPIDLYDSAWLLLASFSLEVQFCETKVCIYASKENGAGGGEYCCCHFCTPYCLVLVVENIAAVIFVLHIVLCWWWRILLLSFLLPQN
jgi:hypothetical protein